MKGRSRILNLALLSAMLLWAATSHAGEAFIKKVSRGGRLTIDQGAEAGLVVGMEVRVVRPPSEAIIHPVTGANLGSPEIYLGAGEITKTSARAAAVRLRQTPLMSVQPNDMVRFTTPEEEMIMDQERSVITQEKAQQERQQIKSNVSDLTRNIKRTQGMISELKKTMNRLDRIDEGIKVRLSGITDDVNALKDEVKDLKETVSLMGVVPVSGEGEGGGIDLEDEESRAQLEELIRSVVQEQQVETPPAVEEELPLPLEDTEDLEDLEGLEGLEDEEEGEEDEPSFLGQYWYLLALLVVGLCAILFWFYMRMSGGDDEEEEDEDEEDEDDEDEDDEDEDEDEEELEIEGEEDEIELVDERG